MPLRTLQQPLLFEPTEPMPLKLKQAHCYADSNRDVAALILSDAERYGGRGALAVEWARLVRGGTA